MLQKFALAFKAKTIEFFAEDEDDDDADSISSAVRDLDPAPEAVITGQRVVVLKPDAAPTPVPEPSNSDPTGADAERVIGGVFTTLSSLNAAYVCFQASHSPLSVGSLRAADAAVVGHLRRLSDLKIAFQNPNPSSETLSTYIESQVRENQNLLRSFDAMVNKLQTDVEGRDSLAAELRNQLADLESQNELLAMRLDRALAPLPGVSSGDAAVEAMLSVSVFDSVLHDVLRVTHRFVRSIVDAMKNHGWNLAAAAEALYPGVNYTKRGHCQFAILSQVCLLLFDGFDSYQFTSNDSRISVELSASDVALRRHDALRQFIEHSTVDPLDLMNGNRECDFARFCESKYSSLDTTLVDIMGPLYDMFVMVASSIWTLHRLAWSYDPVVSIFQVARGTNFSEVFMETIVRKKMATLGLDFRREKLQKVGFTVVPGFRVGGTVIQCRVYLDDKIMP